MTRRIGLSLGADVCWPICFEEVLKRLDLRLEWGDGDELSFEVDRVTIEPFDLHQTCRYDVVVDRLTHWLHTSREWIKKAVIMDGLYVFNNPWSVQSMEKQTSYCAAMRLGLPVPETWLIPPKEYLPSADLERTLTSYARMFDLGEIGQRLGYPLYMKPYDGGGWVGVSRIEGEPGLRAAYEQSGRHIMHLQSAVRDFDRFVRCIGVGPQVHMVSYDPAAPLHDRYTLDRDFLADGDHEVLEDLTLTLNAFFGWDFNSCEAMRSNGVWHPIDFANPCPDSQVTSLHWHFPWMVAAILRWSLFCAATKRPMRMNLDWAPFFVIAERTDLDDRERLAAYATLARQRFDAAGFAAFCDQHLPHLDQVVWEFFGSDGARGAIRQKVEALFPVNEVEQFTELFWQRVQAWRAATAGTRA